ncbi:MAG: hypothetical protein ACYC56_09540 [Candidatus Aquicultor sp.]
MQKQSGKVEVWLEFLAIVCIICGIAVGFMLYTILPESFIHFRIGSLAMQIIIPIACSTITFAITYYVSKQKLAKRQKELARKSIKKTYELLRTTSRTLDTIDLKAGAILNNANDSEFKLDRELAHEFMQNIRNQVIEVYNSVSICIEDWRDIMADEFEHIEKKERLLDKIILEQIIKARHLQELNQDKEVHAKEILAIKADMARLAERQRTSQTEIISESRKLIGAPITTAISFTNSTASQSKFEQLVKLPVYAKEYEPEVDEIL